MFFCVHEQVEAEQKAKPLRARVFWPWVGCGGWDGGHHVCTCVQQIFSHGNFDTVEEEEGALMFSAQGGLPTTWPE